MTLTANEEGALKEIVFNLTGPHTQEEIAEHLGYTVRGVRFIEERALAKLHALASPEWADGLDEPLPLARRMNAVFASDGGHPKTETES